MIGCPTDRTRTVARPTDRPTRSETEGPWDWIRNAQSAEKGDFGGINDRCVEGPRTILLRSLSRSSRDVNGREMRGGRRDQEGQRSRAHKTRCGYVCRRHRTPLILHATVRGFQNLRRDYICNRTNSMNRRPTGLRRLPSTHTDTHTSTHNMWSVVTRVA